MSNRVPCGKNISLDRSVRLEFCRMEKKKKTNIFKHEPYKCLTDYEQKSLMYNLHYIIRVSDVGLE